jgi:hypothetical protein
MGQQQKPQPAKWPFDPMQPGDHEPVPAPPEDPQ